MLISSNKIPRNNGYVYDSVFGDFICSNESLSCFWDVHVYFETIFVTSAQCASSSVYGVAFQESSLVPERCFLDILQCCYNSSLVVYPCMLKDKLW